MKSPQKIYCGGIHRPIVAWQKVRTKEVNLHIAHAMVCQNEQDFDGAMDYPEQPGSRDENYDYVHFQRGRLLEKMGKAWMAYESFSTFLELAVAEIPTG